MYTKALEYFLESNRYFHINIFDIVDYSFMGTCSDGKKEYKYMTDISLELFRIEQENNGYYLILHKANAENYFSKDYSDMQLTSIILSIIFNRSKDEINFISSKRYKAYGDLILYNLLCGKTLFEIKEIFTKIKSYDKRTAELTKNFYSGVYYIYENACPIQEILISKNSIQAHRSTKVPSNLIDNNGNKYEMIF